MNSDSINTVVGAVICLVISVVGVSFLLGSLDQQFKSNVKQQLNGNSIGPLDDSMADMAGLPRRAKPKFVLPQAKPIDMNFDF